MIGKKIDELIEKINSMDDIYLVWWLGFILLVIFALADSVAQ